MINLIPDINGGDFRKNSRLEGEDAIDLENFLYLSVN